MNNAYKFINTFSRASKNKCLKSITKTLAIKLQNTGIKCIGII